MKQPHTEDNIAHTGDDQNTGNHKMPDATDAKGADKFGGSRTGSENVETNQNKTEDTPSEPEA